MRKYKDLLNYACVAIQYLSAIMDNDRKNVSMHFSPKDYDTYLKECTELDQIRQSLLKMMKT